MATLPIDTLGPSFAIQANENEEYLEKLLNYYRRIVSQVESESGLKDSLKISIIAGIMICDELCKEKQKLQYTNQTINRQDLDEAEKITLRIIDNLNKVTK